MLSLIRPAVLGTVMFTLLLGVAYPLAVTGAAEMLAPAQAGGSLIRDRTGHVVGSVLIAQAFVQPEYLHPRPSAAGKGYDASSSGGSNSGPLNPDLAKRVAGEAEAIRRLDGAGAIAADAVTASGSGLDPEISPANARMQAPRIARSRGIDPATVQAVIAAQTEPPVLGFIGQARVNVLKVNLALDARYPVAQHRAP